MIKKILIGFLLLLLIAAGVGYFYVTENLKAKSQETTVVEFEVPEGSNVSTISEKLEAEGLIRNSFLTRVLISTQYPELANIKTGSFELNPSMKPEEIFAYINDSNNIIIKTYRMTFIEGEWAKDYASVIARNTNLSTAEILAQWNDTTYINQLIEDYEVLTPEIVNNDVRVFLEGYFSPNTYEFYLDATLDDITRTLLNPTEKFYQDNKALFDQSSLSIHDVFKLASMVQFEASVPDDQKKVASVFLNRMAIHMPLQSSVTVCYALYEYEHWTDCEQQYTISSPYNTYIVDGLPVGPISNPRHEVIASVLTPEETPYYYFIADVFGVRGTQGAVFFTETFEEHEALRVELLEGRY